MKSIFSLCTGFSFHWFSKASTLFEMLGTSTVLELKGISHHSNSGEVTESKALRRILLRFLKNMGSIGTDLTAFIEALCQSPRFSWPEALEVCQTRISKMELQQQQQQVVQLEGLENATARTLLGKLINVLLAVMAVLLVFVSTVANCVVPLMKTRSRTFSTLLFVVLLAFLWRNWEVISHTGSLPAVPS
ncbi:hypothetical protein J4Q44_G00107540 [Coregonus suidteri]|uniref:Uncharacterized protein n=1 Tax=Coregonus suidteri TaxID=861788 RepID=A0AAN8LVM1_9TELE